MSDQVPRFLQLFLTQVELEQPTDERFFHFFFFTFFLPYSQYLSMFACVQHTQSLFGPAGLAFMRMAAHMDHVGQPMKLLYGVNGHGGGPLPQV